LKGDPIPSDIFPASEGHVKIRSTKRLEPTESCNRLLEVAVESAFNRLGPMTPATMQELAMLGPHESTSSEARTPLARAMERLESIGDGAQSVVDLVHFGGSALPPLRSLLLRREKSGLHQARCRATDALVALKGYDILDEFLRLERPINDPVERLGEETVISAAARALARRRDERTFKLLDSLARRRSLTGVLVALGSFKRVESIPVFIRALSEDEVRLTAEAVLRNFGSRARQHLLAAVCGPDGGIPPSESDHRKRRSVLGLLGELRIRRSDWPRLKPFLRSDDLETAILAAGLGLKIGDPHERKEADIVLRELRLRTDSLRRLQIDQYLQRFTSPSRQRIRAKVMRG
jgi:hypothetical protein